MGMKKGRASVEVERREKKKEVKVVGL